jgi:hypothetical protein
VKLLIGVCAIAALSLSTGCCCRCECVQAKVPDADGLHRCGACSVTSETKFADDPALVADLVKYAELSPLPSDASAEELALHCNPIWDDAVEGKHCGDVVIPGFCESCGVADRDQCQQGNSRGRILQRCREEALPVFTASYAACRDFVLCGDKLQHKDVKCKAD